MVYRDINRNLINSVTSQVFTKVDFLQGKNVIHVCAGNEHTVVLADNGVSGGGSTVYTVGYNDNGQCGLGNTGRVSKLTVVDRLVDKGAYQVRIRYMLWSFILYILIYSRICQF